MKQKNKWLLLSGLGLMIAGLCLVLLFTGSQTRWQKQASSIVRQIEAALPERTPGVPEAYVKNHMPALQLQGQDFIGLVEIPAYGVKLPLCGSWKPGNVNRFPCRFSGSVYDSSLILGGSASQLACLKTVSHGDVVTVTDLQGRVYSYQVTNIRRADNAKAETLGRDDANLVLFIRDLYTMEYIIVACN